MTLYQNHQKDLDILKRQTVSMIDKNDFKSVLITLNVLLLFLRENKEKFNIATVGFDENCDIVAPANSDISSTEAIWIKDKTNQVYLFRLSGSLKGQELNLTNMSLAFKHESDLIHPSTYGMVYKSTSIDDLIKGELKTYHVFGKEFNQETLSPRLEDDSELLAPSSSSFSKFVDTLINLQQKQQNTGQHQSSDALNVLIDELKPRVTTLMESSEMNFQLDDLTGQSKFKEIEAISNQHFKHAEGLFELPYHTTATRHSIEVLNGAIHISEFMGEMGQPYIDTLVDSILQLTKNQIYI